MVSIFVSICVSCFPFESLFHGNVYFLSKIFLKPDGLMHVISMVEAECDIWILDVERSPFAWQEAGPPAGPKIDSKKKPGIAMVQQNDVFLNKLHHTESYFIDLYRSS